MFLSHTESVSCLGKKRSLTYTSALPDSALQPARSLSFTESDSAVI